MQRFHGPSFRVIFHNKYSAERTVLPKGLEEALKDMCTDLQEIENVFVLNIAFVTVTGPLN
jgi:hypothetical protein